MSSFEKSVKGATKIKLAPPKAKYVEHILQATRAGEAGAAEVFRSLQYRLRDTTWTTTFKSLIVVHLMIREGGANATLGYLSTQPRQILGGPLHTYADVQTQGRNIRHYTTYLIERAKAYRDIRVDYVLAGEGRMKKLTVDKGLLRETQAVQEQINALLKCDLLSDEPENEITLTAFRLLTMDLLALFPVMNEGAINVLEHFFEMSQPDAERALSIYKTFAKQTDLVVRFLSVAKQHEHATRLEIPKIRHAPLSLATSLEEYLNDADFETNRRQYLVLQDAKKNGGSSEGSKPPENSRPTLSKATWSESFHAPKEPSAKSNAPQLIPASKPFSPDLVDFFGSIEQSSSPPAPQFTSFQQQSQPQPTFNNYPQQTGYASQGLPQQQSMPTGQYIGASPQLSNNPFGQMQQPQQQVQLQPQYTGAGFGGYGPQPTQLPPQQFPQQQQQPFQAQPTQAQSNPFRQPTSPTMPDHFSANPWGAPQQQQIQQQPQIQQQQQQPSNPYGALQTTPQPTSQPWLNNDPFPSQPPTQQPLYPSQTGATNPFQPQPALLIPSQTGSTNPFARALPPTTSPTTTTSANQQSPPPAVLLTANPTGSTNPFRQSAFVNQATGQGWQHGPQGTLGGLERMGTVEVFPRPGQGQAQGQGQGQNQGWY